MWRFFSNFKKWPSPVTNVPKQQPNYRLSRTPTSTIWSDRLTAQSGVARQPNYSPWQVDLCAAVGTLRTDVVHTGGLPAMQTNMWRGEIRLIDAFVLSSIAQLKACTGAVPVTDALFDPNSKLSLLGRPLAADRPYLFAFDFSSWRRCYVPVTCSLFVGLGLGELLFERNVWSNVFHL